MEYNKIEKPKSKLNYIFWLILLVVLIFYFYKSLKTDRVVKTEEYIKMELDQSEVRPQSGELEFN